MKESMKMLIISSTQIYKNIAQKWVSRRKSKIKMWLLMCMTQSHPSLNTIGN